VSGPGPDDPDLDAAPAADDGERAFDVVGSDAGLRLDVLLARLYPEFSRSRLAALCDSGDVTLDGRPVKPGQRLREGQSVRLRVPDPVPATPQPEDIPLRFLFEDRDLVVVDKPAGLVVHPAAGVPDGTLVNALLFHVRDLQGISGELRPGIVHRLDRDTSGAIVVAKHDRALAALQHAFQARTVEKRYLALVFGHPPDAGTWDTRFGRHPTDRVRMTSRSPTGPDRRAVTHFTTLEHFADAALLDVVLETGRTHQIRVHCSESGFPLLGDATYGGTKRASKESPKLRAIAEKLGRQALHARVLDFPHPVSGERVRCEAPVPPDLQAALDALRKG